MATIGDIIGKGAKEAIESTVKNTNKVVNEVVEEVVEETGKKGNKRKKKKNKRSKNKNMDVNDVDPEYLKEIEKEIKTNRSSSDELLNDMKNKSSFTEEQRKTIEMNREKKRQEKIDAEIERQRREHANQEQGRMNAENAEIERKKRETMNSNDPNKLDTYAELDQQKNENTANSSFAGSEYEEYAKKHKVDEKSFDEKAKQAELKERLELKHGSRVKDQIKTEENAKDSRKFFTNDNIKKTIGLGVGGALVFNMFDKGGQMSNAELYGQQSPYGY